MNLELDAAPSDYSDDLEIPNDLAVPENTIYNMAGIEVKPEFPGGMAKFDTYFQKNFRMPAEANLSGKIFVSFVVEKDGSLSDIKVLRDIGYGTGQEAIRFMKSSPKWIPGQQNGKIVRVQFTMPLNIKPNANSVKK